VPKCQGKENDEEMIKGGKERERVATTGRRRKANEISPPVPGAQRTREQDMGKGRGAGLSCP